MTPDELARELAAGTLRPVYLLAGEEPLLREDALRSLRQAVLAGAGDAFDLDRLSGARLEGAALLDAIRRLPALAPRRLVLLDEPEASRGGVGDKLVEAVHELGQGARVDGLADIAATACGEGPLLVSLHGVGRDGDDGNGAGSRIRS